MTGWRSSSAPFVSGPFVLEPAELAPGGTRDTRYSVMLEVDWSAEYADTRKVKRPTVRALLFVAAVAAVAVVVYPPHEHDGRWFAAMALIPLWPPLLMATRRAWEAKQWAETVAFGFLATCGALATLAVLFLFWLALGARGA
jgi:hypothetical protein